MKILAISDTHIPRVANDLPKEVYDAVEGVDLILHAGDFVEKDLLKKLSALRPITAVYGNMDCSSLQAKLNAKEIVSAGGFRIGLIHGYGAPSDLVDTVKNEFRNVDAIVFGHSHIPLNITKDGVLFFNPGSPTDKIFARTNSYGIIEVTEKSITGKIITIRD